MMNNIGIANTSTAQVPLMISHESKRDRKLPGNPVGSKEYIHEPFSGGSSTYVDTTSSEQQSNSLKDDKAKDYECEGIMTQEEINAQIAEYEQLLGMTADEFLQHVKEGTAPDTFEAMDLSMLLEYS